EVDGMVPFGGVERGPAEGVDTGNVRHGGAGELAHGGDEHIGGEQVAVAGADLPFRGGFVVFGVADLGVEADVAFEIVFACYASHVVVDIGLLGETPGPIGAGLVGRRVQGAGYVAWCAWVRLFPPAAGDVVGAFNDGEIVYSDPQEFQPDTERTEPAPDDADRRRCHGSSVGR